MVLDTGIFIIDTKISSFFLVYLDICVVVSFVLLDLNVHFL